MFSGHIVRGDQPLRYVTVTRADGGVDHLCDAREGSLPGSVEWEEAFHGPIPPGWKVVAFRPAERVCEIAGEWYAPTLRLVSHAQRLTGWLSVGASMFRCWWLHRPQRIRDARKVPA